MLWTKSKARRSSTVFIFTQSSVFLGSLRTDGNRQTSQQAVGLYTEKGDAVAILSTVDTKKSVREIDGEVRANAMRSNSVIVQSARDTTVINKAYLIGMRQAERRDVDLDGQRRLPACGIEFQEIAT